MGLMDKIKNMVVGVEEEYEDDLSIISKGNNPPPPVYDADNHKTKNKVVNIHTTAQLQVVLVKPERFEDASGIADHLNSRRTVVLNLEAATKDVSRRLVDFLSGVAYANNGQLKRVANSTFIITPYHVDLMGDLIDELESNGIFF